MEEHLLNSKDILGKNELGIVLITLKDGRCACVDLLNKGVIVEVLLDSFLKWGDFSLKVVGEEKMQLKKILENPNWVRYGPLAKDYLENQEINLYFNALKKEAQYQY